MFWKTHSSHEFYRKVTFENVMVMKILYDFFENTVLKKWPIFLSEKLGLSQDEKVTDNLNELIYRLIIDFVNESDEDQSERR